MLTGLLALFAIGTLPFWLLFAGLVGVILLLTELEAKELTTTVAIATIAVLWALWPTPVLPWIAENFIWLLAGLIGYVAAGAVWAVVKWTFFVSRLMEHVEPIVAKYRKAFEIQRSRYPSLPDAQKKQLGEDSYVPIIYEGNAYEYDFSDETKANERLFDNISREAIRIDDMESFPPHPTRYKSKIMFWLCYWPFSLVVTLINDPIRKLFRMVYRNITRLLTGISVGMTARATGFDSKMLKSQD